MVDRKKEGERKKEREREMEGGRNARGYEVLEPLFYQVESEHVREREREIVGKMMNMREIDNLLIKVLDTLLLT